MYNAHHIFVHIIPGLLCPLHPWYVIIIPMCKAHPYFSLKNLSKKLYIIHGEIWYLSAFSLNHLYCYSITVVPVFSPLPSSTLPLPPLLAPTVSSHTIVHVRASFIHLLCPVPPPSFQHYPPSCSPLVTFSLFHVSMPVVLFKCFFAVYFIL